VAAAVRSRIPRLTRPLVPSLPPQRNASFKAAYLAFNAVILYILYGCTAGALYVQEGPGESVVRDGSVEAWLWAVILASWLAYWAVQGSDPGYILPGASSASSGPEGVPESSIEVEVGVVVEEGRGREGTRVVGEEAPAAPAPALPSASASEPAGRGRERPAEGDTADLVGRAGGEGEAEAARLALAGARECLWCTATQPARAHHCRDCDRCVALFDHHCSWIGTCVGERNRARFWAFLATQSLALATAIGVLNTAFVWRRGMSDWVYENLPALSSLVVLWCLQLFIFGLFVFHSWLALTNTTTYETSVGPTKLWYLAGTEGKPCDLPYSAGTCTNLRLFCCTLDTGGNCGRKRAWAPTVWSFPGKVERESADIWTHPWENRYFSCC